MCEKIFGQKYKWNEQKHDYEPYSRTDMWNKMIEQQDKIADLETKLAESEKALEAKESVNQMYKATLSLKDSDFSDLVRENAELKQQLAEKDKAIENWQTIYESVVQTCHNDKEEIERLNKKLAEKDKEIEKLKKQVQEKDLLYKSLLAMATQLNDVYDTEGCMYGDEISGDTPEETANAYIEETKKKLREKNNG